MFKKSLLNDFFKDLKLIFLSLLQGIKLLKLICKKYFDNTPILKRTFPFEYFYNVLFYFI